MEKTMFTKIEIYLSSSIKDAEDFLKDNSVQTDNLSHFLTEQAEDKIKNETRLEICNGLLKISEKEHKKLKVILRMLDNWSAAADEDHLGLGKDIIDDLLDLYNIRIKTPIKLRGFK
jgi:hypothetical protein